MVLNKGTLFDPELVTDLISKVAGKAQSHACQLKNLFRSTVKKFSHLRWIQKLMS